MREESPNVTVTLHYRDPEAFPDTLFNLWANDRLDDFFPVPEGSKVEVVEGEIIVSPAAPPEHNGFVADIIDSLGDARRDQPDFPWGYDVGSGLVLVGTEKGFVPDLTVLDRQAALSVRRTRAKKLVSDEAEMVVEITSPGNADTDRRPRTRRNDNKWNSYAASGIPYYLLVDRDPKVARVFLYSIPDEATAAYLHEDSWAFGETIRLPEPLDFEIDTELWEPWE
ncbi:Uma2 family endonuclease [Actinomadura kijaniata]|uniref:Uma2 family endonuclease n=1 Tax=Actinomadura kijaniata TaxID=46161 RepID=UPI0014722055|nr:Uma2 family endonuclease [Actinomadura kijaniata]